MSRLEFEFSIPASHPAIPGHFPGNPVVPGVLLIDKILAFLLERSGLEMARLQHVKFSSVLSPNQPARVTCDVVGGRVTFLVTSPLNTQTIFASGKMIMQIHADETLDN